MKIGSGLPVSPWCLFDESRQTPLCWSSLLAPAVQTETKISAGLDVLVHLDVMAGTDSLTLALKFPFSERAALTIGGYFTQTTAVPGIT